MINLTLEQAKLALEIICNDMEMSEFSMPDYKDTSATQYYFNRAVLYERLSNAIDKELGAV